MSLRDKIISIFFVVVLLSVTVLKLISNHLLDQTFTELEKREMEQNLSRATNAIHSELIGMDSLCGDYAGWDDTYTYVVNHDPAYITENFIPESFRKLRLNLVMIVDRQGGIVMAMGYDRINEKPVLIPKSFYRYVRPGAKLLQHTDPSSSLQGMLLLPEGPLMVVSRPLLNSQYRGPIRGTLIMGRFVDSLEMKYLQNTTNLSFSIGPYEPGRFGTGAQSKEQVIAPVVKYPDQLAGYQAIRDIEGRPAAVIGVTMKRDIFQKNKEFFANFMLFLMIFIALCSVAAYLLFRQLVLVRLFQISSVVSTIGASNDPTIRVPIRGSDELAALGEGINDMLLTLQASQQHLTLSENRYRAVVEDQTELIFRFRRDGTITFANQAFTRYVGRPLNLVLETRVRDLVSDKDWQDILALLDHLIVTREVVFFERMFRNAQGERRWHNWTCRLISVEGEPNHEFQAVGRNVHDRKMIETRLILDEMRLEALLSMNQMAESNPRELTDYALEEAVRLTGSKYGFVAFVQDERLMVIDAWSRQTARDCLADQSDTVILLENKNFWGEAVRTRQPVIINDYESIDPKPQLPHGHVRLRRALIVPIVEQDKAVSLIGVANKDIEYDQSDIRQVTLLMNELMKILQRRRVKQALEDSERQLALQVLYLNTLIDSLNELFVTYDDQARINFVNAKSVEFWGFQPEELLGRYVWELVEPEQRSSIASKVARRLSRGKMDSFDLQLVNKKGEAFDARINASPIIQDGNVVGGLVLAEDISERKAVEEKLRYLGMHDPLTGLYNRAYFEEELDRMERGRHDPVGLIVSDVDGLKLMNDGRGHAAGDALLIEVTRVLRTCLRDGDVIARVGGDEFGVILPNSPEATVQEVCDRIRRTTVEHNEKHPDFPVSLSIGYAVRQDASLSVYDLYKMADDNMYREKLQSSTSARSSMIHNLLKSLEPRDFFDDGHPERLAVYLEKMMEALGEAYDIDQLQKLARFHDIGKVSIADAVLFKPGPLSPEEMQDVRRHSETGHRIAQAAPDLSSISDWLLKHHEWYNGQGYPLGLKGHSIPIECRILSIADAYDAMTHARPQRAAMDRAAALLELTRMAGTQFDPDLVPLFIKISGDLEKSR